MSQRFRFGFPLFLWLAGIPLQASGPWISLFDGRSFAGWRSPSGQTELAAAWKIVNGTMTVRPHVQHRTDLWTDAEYDNFELVWEWMAQPGANSGIKYWVQDATTLIVVKEDEEWRRVPNPSHAGPGDITIEYSRGFEYQMAAPDEPTALLKPMARAGALYELIPPSPETVHPARAWNKSRLVVNGERIEHWLNGKQVMNTTLDQLAEVMRDHPPNFKLERRRGPIALQYHQTEVAFRKIRVRRL